MNCFVYKGSKKQDHFLYLDQQLEELADGSLPNALVDLLGELEFVLEFDLTSNRKLPNADAQAVIDDIQSKGFFLQMPRESMWQLEEQFFN
jgi:uncharacterized protein YcgL (UPF0745 family)